MKPLIVLAMIFSMSVVFADSFRLDKDGQEYLCSSTSPSNPGGAVECVNKAYNGIFSKEEAIDLCSGDSSVANVECAQKAYSGPYSKAEAIRMCKANPQLMLRSLNLLRNHLRFSKKSCNSK